MKYFFIFSSLSVGFFASLDHSPAERIRVNPDKVEGTINPMIYGQFLEHIYDSVVDGLSSQIVRGPSFEEPSRWLPGGWEVIQGAWFVQNEELVNDGMGTDNHVLIGELEWADYDFQIRAQKKSGLEGFLILVRATDNNNFYWWNLGGWGNTRSAIEHEVDGVRHLVPGTEHPIRIEQDRDYTIRIEAKGEKVRCLLDGSLVCEFDDTTNRRGRVGVGTWATSAVFGEVRVISGKKDLLKAAHGDTQPAQSISRAWSVIPGYEKDRYEWTTEKPLNSKHCQKILSRGKGAGIFQGNLPVIGGKTYSGSLWIRGEAEKCVVRLKMGTESQQIAFNVYSADWVEVPLEFTPKSDTDQAELSIELEGGGEIWVDQCYLQLKDSIFRPNIFEKVADIHPTFIRWPGGCYAEHYHWQDGIGPLKNRSSKPNLVWGGVDPNNFGTDEFIRLCREVKAEPLIVLNIGHHDSPDQLGEYIKEALAWEEYCNGDVSTPWGAKRAENGHPEPYRVKFWEIGNETWSMGVEKYAESARQFVDALRKQNPSLKFLLCGSGGHNHDWNREIIRLAATHMDYLSVHHYMAGSFEDEMKNGVEYPRFLQETGELIKKSDNPAAEIAVTEWNQQSIALRTGLYAGLVLNGFERNSDRITMSCPALFIRKTSYKEWDNAFINHDSRRVFTAPNYLVMKLYNDHFAPTRVMVEAPSSLDVMATRDSSSGEIILKVVNPSQDQDVRTSIEITGKDKLSGMRLWRVNSASIDDRNSLDEPDRIRIEESTPSEPEILFPAHSVTVLRIK